MDISDPSSPREIAHNDTPGDATRVTVLDGKAYLADGETGLVVMDVSNPEAPSTLGTGDTPGYAYDVFVTKAQAAGKTDEKKPTVHVYVADGESGLRIMDATDPEAPVEIGHFVSNKVDAREAR